MKVLNETAEEGDRTINSASDKPKPTHDTKVAEERGEGGFFLTGVNVGKEVEDYQMANMNNDCTDLDELKSAENEDNLNPEVVDKLKLIAVVDSARTFSNNDVSKIT